MLLNILELVMLIINVLARIGGTVAIVWLLVTKLPECIATPFLVALAVIVGLGFSIHYDNPNNHQAPVEQATSQEK